MADARQPEPGERVKVVFCGGCNPQIDRSALAAAVPASDPHVRPGMTVRLSGCPRACASHHLHVADDGSEIIVAGELVDGLPTAHANLAAAVMTKLKPKE